MKRYAVLAVAALVLGLCGCFTVETAPMRQGGEHVVMSNQGWKLFDWIPLFCGNADEGATCGIALFRDDVTMEKVQGRFARYAAGRSIDCPVYNFSNQAFIDIFGIPIPYLITYRQITLSGTMK